MGCHLNTINDDGCHLNTINDDQNKRFNKGLLA